MRTKKKAEVTGMELVIIPNNDREKELEEKKKKAKMAMLNGNYSLAGELYKEIAGILFDQGDFENGMMFLNQAERTLSRSHTIVPSYMTHLKRLQQEATALFKVGMFERARNVMVQMIAIADQIGDPILAGNYRENLDRILEKIAENEKGRGKKKRKKQK